MIRRRKRCLFAVGVLLFAIMALLSILILNKDTTYYIKQNSSYEEQSDDIIIVKGMNGQTGRFPDVISTDNGLLAAYYWNSIHAPYVIGDSLGTIRLQRGSKDGRIWDTAAIDLIDSEFLTDNGLGVWVGDDTYYYSEEEALANNAIFCVEARDPNLTRMGSTLILTFFTRLPWDSAFGGHTYFQYNKSCDYTYGRAYIMTSDDEGETWSKPAEIMCDYLDRGSAKRGNVAILDGKTLLIPLYGYNSKLQTNFTTSNILAEFENGIWTFNEYSSHNYVGTDEPGAFEHGVTEVSFATLNKKIYALLRDNGDVLESYDLGANWTRVDCSGKDENFTLHQPSLLTIENSKQIVATWSEPNDIGGRDIYMLLYKPIKDNVWKWNYKYRIYHNDEPGDMADPTSILLEGNDILTIYYDAQREVVACKTTELIEIK